MADRHPALGGVPAKAAVAAKTVTTKSGSAPKGSRAFNAAFRAARKSGKAEFSFGGKRFNTKLAPTKTTTTVATKAVAAKPASQVVLNRQGQLNTAMGRNAAGARVPATGDVAGRAKARTFFDRAPATPEARERARRALDRGGDFKARSEATFKRSVADGVMMAAGGGALRTLGAAAARIPGASKVASKAVSATRDGVSKVFSAGLRKTAADGATKTVAKTTAKKATADGATKKVVAKEAVAKTPPPTQAIPTRAPTTMSTRARLNASTAAPRPASTSVTLPVRARPLSPEITKTTRLEGTKVITPAGAKAIPKAEMRAALKIEKAADKAALAGSAKSPAEVVAAARARGMMPSPSVARANIADKLATKLTPRAALRSGTATRGLPSGSAMRSVRSGERTAKTAEDAMTARTNAEASRRAGVQSQWTRRQADRSRAEVDSYKGPDAQASAPKGRTRAPNKTKAIPA